MKIEIEVTGFTPVLDNLIEEYGLVTAAIYGIIWRYSQMSNKVCNAPLEKIGKRLALSGKTAERHMKTLCTGGYLIDLTPELRNKPHTYAVTGKAELAGTIASRTDRESYRGQTESRSRSDRESHRGQTESPLKIHSKDTHEDISENPQKPKTKNLTPQQKAEITLTGHHPNVSQHTPDQRQALNTLGKILARHPNITAKTTDDLKSITLIGYEIAKITKTDINTIDATELKALAGLTIRLSAKPNIEAKLPAFQKWWYAEDWRGKQRQPPTVKTLGSTWGQFEAAKVAPPNAASNGPVLTEAKKQRLAELVAAGGE
jgi:hypothetical protein